MKFHFKSIAIALSVYSPLLMAESIPMTSDIHQHMAHQQPRIVHQHRLSMQQALAVVERAGFKNITKIEYEHGQYEVKAYTPRGNQIKLMVNPNNGVITEIKEHHNHHHE